MFILILTLLMSADRNGGPAVAIQSGFASEASCLAVGNAWLRQNHETRYTNTHKTALCVKV